MLNDIVVISEVNIRRESYKYRIKYKKNYSLHCNIMSSSNHLMCECALKKFDNSKSYNLKPDFSVPRTSIMRLYCGGI